MKKIGILLSGCGVFDGTEIHEAVLTMLAVDRAGGKIVCMAPDMDQLHVMNHLTQEEMDEKRNVLVESARIARGEVENLKKINADQLDALIVPGGFGAAKNLCDFALKGPDASVNLEVKRLLGEMIENKKPIGALCIAPALIVSALSDYTPSVTIGNDTGIAAAIEKTGASHITQTVDGICIDEKNRIVTTPAYMLGPSIKDIAVGIEKLVKKIVSMC